MLNQTLNIHIQNYLVESSMKYQNLNEYLTCLRKHTFDTFHRIHCEMYNFCCGLITFST